MNSQRSDRIIRKSRKPFKRRDSSQRSNLGNSLSASPKVTKRNRTHAVSSRNVHRVMHCLEKVPGPCDPLHCNSNYTQRAEKREYTKLFGTEVQFGRLARSLQQSLSAGISIVHRSKLIFLTTTLLMSAFVAKSEWADPRPNDFSLANLTPSKGSMFYGVYNGSKIGGLVSEVGDINGDGYDDIIVGARHVFSNKGGYRIVLGQASPYGVSEGVNVQAGNLSPSAGFVIVGAYTDDQWGGVASGLGDINGDHMADFIVCSQLAKVTELSSMFGVCYVFLGQSAVLLGPDIYLSGYETGTNSDPWLFKITGGNPNENVGSSASGAGDVNGDGFDDIIIGAKNVAPNGAAIVLFGHHYSQPFSDIALATFTSGPNGFWIRGEFSDSQLGFAVSSAGDFNEDGYDDVIVGAPLADPLTRITAGVAYVILGRSNATDFVTVDLANLDVVLPSGNRAGFRILGGANGSSIGDALGGGSDVNDDGLDDILIGASSFSSPSSVSNGAVYVLFGHTSTTLLVDVDLVDFVSDANRGFLLHGAVSNDRFGSSVSMAGDVNGDGIGDIVVGAPMGDQIAVLNDVGMVYVIYGRRASFPFTANIDMYTFTTGPGRGIVIAGVSPGDLCGISVSSAGDFNNDGVADFLIGASDVNYLAEPRAGKAYLLYGTPPKVPVSRTAPVYESIDVGSPLPATVGFRIIGEYADDQTGSAVSNVGDFNGDGFDDYVIGAMNADRGGAAMGVANIVFGTSSPTDVDLRLVNGGTGGFRVVGNIASDNLGNAVSAAGDFNGDGYSDILIGAYRADSFLHADTGVVYVIFGHGTDLPYDNIDPAQSLMPDQGFMIYGEELDDGTGFSVGCAGDMNGDGIDDIIIGAHEADNGQDAPNAGKAYVIFGRAQLGVGDIDLSSSLANVGFCVVGAAQGEQCGYSANGAGDFNGDGYADIIVGCPSANPEGMLAAGAAYVIFANANVGFPDIALDSFIAGPSSGFRVTGAGGTHYTGFGVSTAGDINGDGLADVLVSAPGGQGNAGIVYVLFGNKAKFFLSDVDLASFAFNSSVGFRIYGAYSSDYTRVVSAAGEVNGDGISDIIIGAPFARDQDGTAYVIFGRATNIEDIYLLNFVSSADMGFQIRGATNSGAMLGYSVSAAGDVNNDGVGDIIIGAYLDSPLGRFEAGVSYVLFGTSSEIAFNEVDLADFYTSSATGLIIQNIPENEIWKNSVKKAGDVNGDGIDDIIVASSTATYLDREACGIVYVIFGDSTDLTPYDLDLLDFVSGVGTGFRIIGAASFDEAGTAVSGAGDINHDGYADVLVGVVGIGITYVVFGHDIYAPFPDIDLTSFNTGPAVGFRILGSAADKSGISLAQLGDVNGDGVDDVIVGAYSYNHLAVIGAGAAYVIYGRNVLLLGPMPDVNLTTLHQDSSLGFMIVGHSDMASLGFTVDGAGDFNNDGLMDIIVGAPLPASSTGRAHLIFGNKTRIGVLQSSTLQSDPMSGFTIVGAMNGDFFGWSVDGAGDVNGDGFDDVIIGAKGATAPAARAAAGISYLIFGRAIAAVADIDCGSFITSTLNGYKIFGAVASEASGYAVSGAGDLNGDGYADLVLSAVQASSLGRNNAGKAYVLFGQDFNLPVNDIDLLTFQSGTSTGFVVQGAASNDHVGIAVSAAGDVNGDGVDDLLVASYKASTQNGLSAGVVYLIFGDIPQPTSQPSSQPSGQPSQQPTSRPSEEVIDIDLRQPQPAGSIVHILGTLDGEQAGQCVSNAGDVDGDGYEDFLIGIPMASPNARNAAGSTSLLYGKAEFTMPNISLLAALDPGEGTWIHGAAEDDNLGFALSTLGDFNNDGYDDFVVGAPAASHLGVIGRGIAYVFLGRATRFSASIELNVTDMVGDMLGFRVIGGENGDLLGHSVSGAGDVNGDGYSDLIVGARNEQRNTTVSAAGKVYVLFGHSASEFPFEDIILTGFVSNVQGFHIIGASVNDFVGTAVSSAGDFNGDGFGDIIVGASGANGGTGAAYLIFGHNATVLFSDVDLLFSVSPMYTKINGISDQDATGTAVSTAGDINQDGYDDVLVAAPAARPSGPNRIGAGKVFVLFGTGALVSDIDLSLFPITSAAGFYILGAYSNDFTGSSLGCARDLNGDGISDVLVGVPNYDTPATSGSNGAVYVIFGHSMAQPFNNIDLRLLELKRSVGYKITGSADFSFLGQSVSVLDVNGDAVPDLLLGAPGSSVAGRANAGAVYIILGTMFIAPTSQPSEKPTPVPTVQPSMQPSRTSMNGYQILGAAVGDQTGRSVSAAGDVNGDGLTDVIVGVPFFDYIGAATNNGAAFVIFGHGNASLSDIDLTNFQSSNDTGFRILGVSINLKLGFMVRSANDVNGDGYDDVIVGAAPLVGTTVLVAMVVFGHSPSAAPFIDIRSDSTSFLGFKIYGLTNGGNFGWVVAGVGDFNGDGFDDIGISAFRSDSLAGETYVLLGHSNDSVFADVQMDDFVASNTTGFVIRGAATDDQSGSAVSGTGDVNGDGLDDMLISAPYHNSNGDDSGMVYLMFGSRVVFNIDLLFFTSGPQSGLRILGAAIGDSLGLSLGSAGDINKDGFDDILVAAPMASVAGRSQAGAVYVLFGHNFSTPFSDANLSSPDPGPTQGFAIFGASSGDKCGYSVSGAGDVTTRQIIFL